jgi:hypothetical protein
MSAPGSWRPLDDARRWTTHNICACAHVRQEPGFGALQLDGHY